MKTKFLTSSFKELKMISKKTFEDRKGRSLKREKAYKVWLMNLVKKMKLLKISKRT